MWESSNFLLLILSVIVILVGKHKGFAPSKTTDARSMTSNPVIIKGTLETTIMQKELLLITPSEVNRKHLTIFKYALLRIYRNFISLILNAALPLIVIFIPGLWQGNEPFGFSMIGILIMYGSFTTARGILNDKLDGTITRILTSPVTSFQYLLQNLMAAMTPLVAQILVVSIVGSILYRWNIGFTQSVIFIYFLFALASVSFSYAWSCLFKEKEISYAIFSILMSLVAMIGGFFIPLSILPDALRYIGALFPAFWVSNGILYLLGGNSMGTYWLSIAILVMFSILYMIFSSKRRII